MRRWYPITLLLLSAVLVLVLASTSGLGRELVLEDDFTAPDGSDPDPGNWSVYTQGMGDSAWIQGNVVITTAANGGITTLVTEDHLASNQFTVLVNVRVTTKEGKPVLLQVNTLDGAAYRPYLTLYFDSTRGWAYDYISGGSMRTGNSFNHNLAIGKWYSVNITYNRASLSVSVKDIKQGTGVWTKTDIVTDQLSKDNVISFGVMGGSRESPNSSFDDFFLWDNQVPPNRPPVWALLPTFQAVEDVLFIHDFGDQVTDPDDAIGSLSITSESIYVIGSDGLTVTFLFPDGITAASVALRLNDGEDHDDTVVEFDIAPVNDPPTHSIPLAQTAVEDVPTTLDLGIYIWDVDSDQASISLSTGSPFASVSGLNLTVTFPNGVLQHDLYLNISDGTYATEALLEFVITPVDDPPTVAGLSGFTAREDSISVLDMAGYLRDEDTASERLTVRTEHPGVQVVGLEVRFLFHTGSIIETVTLEVSDGNSDTRFQLEVTVEEVNDPPAVTVNRTYLLRENEPRTLDMAPFITDEDDILGDLVLTCDHPAVTEVRGFNITLLYIDRQTDHDVTFSVSDGISSTNGSIRIQVLETNDPPVIHGIGGVAPPVELEMGEGRERWFVIDAEDEEQHILRYSIDSVWRGVTVFQNGTLRVTGLHGEVGTFKGRLYVDDMAGGTTAIDFTISLFNVNDPPSPPTILQPRNHSSYLVGEVVAFHVVAYDPDKTHGQVLTVTWNSNISGRLKSLTTAEDLTFTISDLPEGDHTVTVEVSDGQFTRSTWFIVSIFEPEPPPPEEETEPFITSTAGMSMIILVVIIVLVTVALAVFMGRRPEDEPIETEAEPQDVIEADLEDLAAKLDDMATTLETVRATEGEWTESVETAPEVEEEVVPITAEEKADRAHTREVREVMRVLTQLPRGLPTALGGKDLTALAREIVDGPRREVSDGTPIVQIDGHWYVADHGNIGTFLTEWKEVAVSDSPVEERRKRLDQLEQALLNGKISEATYQELKRKYEG